MNRTVLRSWQITPSWISSASSKFYSHNRKNQQIKQNSKAFFFIFFLSSWCFLLYDVPFVSHTERILGNVLLSLVNCQEESGERWKHLLCKLHERQRMKDEKKVVDGKAGREKKCLALHWFFSSSDSFLSLPIVDFFSLQFFQLYYSRVKFVRSVEIFVQFHFLIFYFFSCFQFFFRETFADDFSLLQLLALLSVSMFVKC